MSEFVVIVTLPGTEERFTRTCTGLVVIGRGEECDIHLPHPLVSRRHAEISRTEAGAIVVRDLESSNGTVVQDSPLRAAEVTVEGEAAVQVGPYVLRVTTDVSTDADTLMGETPQYSARLELDRDLRHLNVDGALAIDRLSPQEFQLLDILAGAAPRTVPNQELADAIWGEGQWDSYMLHNLVRRVRRKLEAHGDPAGELLVTVPGLGYRIA